MIRIIAVVSDKAECEAMQESVKTATSLREVPEGKKPEIRSDVVMDYPGSKVDTGMRICDVLVGDDFDIKNPQGQGFPWTILGAWRWDEANGLEELIPLDADTYKKYTVSGQVKEVHNWSGWPEIIK